MLSKNFETFLNCDSSYEDADFVLFGAPFDSTTSFKPGTRFAARAIRTDSFGFEKYSPYLDRSMDEINVFDSGDVEPCFGNSELFLSRVQERTAEILGGGKRPFMIGGEHLVTLGAIRSVAEKYPDLCIVHFDAHTDLRESFFSVELSHATVLRKCHDILGDGRIWQFGIRSGEREEFEWAKTHTHLTKFNLSGLSEAVKSLKGKPVYFTLDLDVLDPAYFWGTGTPEPGGISFCDLLGGIYELSKLNIVGCDVVELAPCHDPSGVSTAVACKVVREMLLAFAKRR